MYEKIERGARLEQLRNSLKITQVKFARTLGITQGYLNQILKGTANISHTVLHAVTINYPNVSTDWLLTGKGDMIKQEVESDAQKRALIPFLDDPGETFLPANIGMMRKRWRLGQDEFGALVNGTRSQVSNWERGKSAPDMITLARLEVMAGLQLHELHMREVLPSEIPENPMQGGIMPMPIQAMFQEIIERLKVIEDKLNQGK